MALFADRRTRVVHDIGMNDPHTHDPSQGLVGWANAARDVRTGRAAAVTPTPLARAATVLPGMMNAPRLPQRREVPFRPNITSPGEQRSRVGAWGSGSMPTSQTVLPGQPMRRSSLPAQTVLPSFLGSKMATGPSFAQRAKSAVRKSLR